MKDVYREGDDIIIWSAAFTRMTRELELLRNYFKADLALVGLKTGDFNAYMDLVSTRQVAWNNLMAYYDEHPKILKAMEVE